MELRRWMGLALAATLALTASACGGDDDDDDDDDDLSTAQLVRMACEKEQDCDPSTFAEEYPEGGLEECAAQISSDVSAACESAARDYAECTIDTSCTAIDEACLDEGIALLTACLTGG